MKKKKKNLIKSILFLRPIDASLTHLASKIEQVCFPSLQAREILGEEEEDNDGVVRFYLYIFSLSKNVSLSATFISFLSLSELISNELSL